MTPDGLEEPTLHVNPGDTLNITAYQQHAGLADRGEVQRAQLRRRFYDRDVHQHSLPRHEHESRLRRRQRREDPGQFGADLPLQRGVSAVNEPPGLYWYHGHVHGLSEASVQGGASGLIVVDGIENVQPAVSGLRQQFLVVRDQPTTQQLPESSPPVSGDVEIPNLDLSTNYIPEDAFTDTSTGVTTFTPAVLAYEARRDAVLAHLQLLRPTRF